MSGRDLQFDAFRVDVRDLLGRSVANLYSHLVTRPTGRAVRLAIESQLDELRTPALSLVDFSSVAVLDYSCADEVVAKLLLRRSGAASDDPRERDIFFLFRGLGDHHREPVLEVLARHGLSAVMQPRGVRAFELLGARTPLEAQVWNRVEAAGRVAADSRDGYFSDEAVRALVGDLADRGLVFRHPLRGDFLALSTLVAD